MVVANRSLHFPNNVNLSMHVEEQNRLYVQDTILQKIELDKETLLWFTFIIVLRLDKELSYT